MCITVQVEHSGEGQSEILHPSSLESGKRMVAHKLVFILVHISICMGLVEGKCLDENGFYSRTKAQCSVQSNRCDFPFTEENTTYSSCQKDDYKLPNGVVMLNGVTNYPHCYSQVGNSSIYGICDSGCFNDDDGAPIEFETDDARAMFCKTKPSPCMFPFTWQGVSYKRCTSEGWEFPWCATGVDDNREIVGNRWGKCNMKTCDMWPIPDIPMAAKVVFSKDDVTGILHLSQQSPQSALWVEGILEGLPFGHYRLRYNQVKCGIDYNIKSETSEEYVKISENNTQSKIKFNNWGVTLYNDTKHMIVSAGSLLLTEHCHWPGKVIKKCPEIVCGDIGDVVTVDAEDCRPSLDYGLRLNINNFIVLVAVLLLLIFIVICCCCKRLNLNNGHLTCKI